MSAPLGPGFVLWLTGLPSAGKTCLARELVGLLAERGMAVQILDSDELRRVLTPDPTYSPQERDWFYDTLGYIAALLARNGVPVIVAATAPRRDHRRAARQRVERFAEIYVSDVNGKPKSQPESGLYLLCQLRVESNFLCSHRCHFEPEQGWSRKRSIGQGSGYVFSLRLPKDKCAQGRCINDQRAHPVLL